MKMPKACIDCSMRDHYGCNLTGKILLDYDFVIGDMVHPDWCPQQKAIKPEWWQGKAYCGSCGAKLPTKKHNIDFCGKCGHMIDWGDDLWQF